MFGSKRFEKPSQNLLEQCMLVHSLSVSRILILKKTNEHNYDVICQHPVALYRSDWGLIFFVPIPLLDSTYFGLTGHL
jgi:hypothetical protein